jgi:hypothetical protein
MAGLKVTSLEQILSFLVYFPFLNPSLKGLDIFILTQAAILSLF